MPSRLPAWFAAANNDRIVDAQHLLEECAGARNEAGETALMIAARLGFCDLVQLLSSTEANYVSPSGRTALMIAAEANQPQTCVLLLHEKDITLSDGQDALTLAVGVSAKDALMAMGPHFPVRRTDDGMSPLDMAVQAGNSDAVRILLATQRYTREDLDIAESHLDASSEIQMLLLNARAAIADSHRDSLATDLIIQDGVEPAVRTEPVRNEPSSEMLLTYAHSMTDSERSSMLFELTNLLQHQFAMMDNTTPASESAHDQFIQCILQTLTSKAPIAPPAQPSRDDPVVSDLETKIEELQQKNQDLDTANRRLIESLAEARETIDRLLSEKEDSTGKSQQGSGSRPATLSMEAEDTAHLQDRDARERKLIRMYQQQIEEIRQKAAEDIGAMQEESRRLQADLEKLAMETNESQRNATILQYNASQYQRELQELRDTVSYQQTENRALATAVKLLQSENTVDPTGQLEGTARLSDEVYVLKQECEMLRSRLRQTSNQLTTLIGPLNAPLESVEMRQIIDLAIRSSSEDVTGLFQQSNGIFTVASLLQCIARLQEEIVALQTMGDISLSPEQKAVSPRDFLPRQLQQQRSKTDTSVHMAVEPSYEQEDVPSIPPEPHPGSVQPDLFVRAADFVDIYPTESSPSGRAHSVGVLHLHDLEHSYSRSTNPRGLEVTFDKPDVELGSRASSKGSKIRSPNSNSGSSSLRNGSPASRTVSPRSVSRKPRAIASVPTRNKSPRLAGPMGVYGPQVSVKGGMQRLASPRLRRGTGGKVLKTFGSQLGQSSNVPDVIDMSRALQLNERAELENSSLEYKGTTPLIDAVLEGDNARIPDLMCYAGLLNSDGITALMIAAMRNNCDAIRLLVEAEAGIKSTQGFLAIRFALMRGYFEAAEILTPYEARKHVEISRKGNRHTELMRAVEEDNIVDIWSLARIQGGLQDEDGRTALMRAAQTGNYEACRILYELESGIKTPSGETSLMIAASANFLKSATILSLRESTMRDEEGVTALMRAAQNNNVAIVKLLMYKEAGLQDSSGRTALMYAAKHKYVEVVRLLASLEAGLQMLSRTEKSGKTALIIAVRRGSLACARILTSYERGIKDAAGRLPISYARTTEMRDVLSGSARRK
ncbi:Ankyrin repeat protein 1 [Giardia muris]|uniref:Ankyrin repeat protein 1 n=1 Tax=Giardia muris TaxID=5742 RepID=A0A4Z1T8J2_GIAMU|nr:Ankyrin repeat protein 1 [Giardia muris]|eukprot:TNJ30443.1 Ankyrin repeat protein 1 [Giardia muris]